MAAPQIPPESLQSIGESGLLDTERNVASNSYVLLKRVAMNTDCVIGGPPFLFDQEVKRGALVELPIRNTPPWIVSVLITRPASHSRIIRDFVACIREQFSAAVTARP